MNTDDSGGEWLDAADSGGEGLDLLILDIADSGNIIVYCLMWRRMVGYR